MQLRRLLVISGTCAAFLTPAAAAAQDDGGFMMEAAPEEEEARPVYLNEIEAGLGFNTEGDFKFGEYTGLEKSEVHAIGNFDVLMRSAWDDDSTEYFAGRGRNLGLESRQMDLEYGRQGSYSVGLGYQQIPHFLIDDAHTPYRGHGGTTLTLPAGWVAAPTTAGFTALNATLRNIEIENDRKKLSGFFEFLPDDNWSIEVDAHREWRDGTKQVFGIFGTNGGNPASVALTEPIDYVTDEVEATVGYTADRWQAEFAYEGSFFNEENRGLVWQNAYTNDPGWSPLVGARSPARMGVPPDNQSHNFRLSGGYTFGQATRLSGSVSYGWMNQDEDFLPFTINPLLATPTPLPRNSADAELTTWIADVAFSTRPMERTDLRAHYRFESRDNDTPQDIFPKVPNDTANQQAAVDGSINLPYSFQRQEFDLDVGYRVVPRAKVSVGYEFDMISRDFSEVNENQEHTGKIKLRGRPVDYTSGWIEYSHAERFANDYNATAPFVAGHTAAHVAAATPSGFPSFPAAFENHPLIRKFNMAERSKDQVKAAFSWTPMPTTQVGLSGSFTNEDFSDDVILGLEERRRWHGGLDVSYTPQEDVSTYAYYSFEQIEDQQRNHEFRPFGPTMSLIDPAQRWTREGTDRVHSVGAGVSWAAIVDKLDISLDYTLSLAETEYEFQGGADLAPVSDAPDLESTLHSLQLRADYWLREFLRLRFGYRFERFRSDDFALDGVGLTPAGDLLTFAASSPEYTAHVFGVSVVANF